MICVHTPAEAAAAANATSDDDVSKAAAAGDGAGGGAVKGLLADDETGAYFNDGLRKIDMVLAFTDLPDQPEEKDNARQHKARRRVWRATFEANLVAAGRCCHGLG